MSEAVLTCRLLVTGHCIASGHHLLAGGPHGRIEIPSMVALLGHPTRGYLLWDTGYAPRMLDMTKWLPWRVYRWITPLRVSPEQAAVAQLAAMGVEARDVRRVVLSHFHADHVSGLRDFPLADVVASKAAYADVAGRTGLSALSRAFLPKLLPRDFERRAVLLDDFTPGEPGPTCDLFGDGSAMVVSLPGHARGQIGLLARTTRGAVLFAADSCWMSEGYRTATPPHWITNLFIDDVAAMRETLGRVHRFWKADPAVMVIPSHCPEAWGRYGPVFAGEGGPPCASS